MNRSLAYIFLLPLALAPACDAGVFVQSPSEKPQAFAARVLALPSDADQHVVAATWNGKKYLFVDYLEGENRQVVALEQIGDRQYRRIFVTMGEEEGGDADVAAIGFAPSKSASRDRLIVLLNGTSSTTTSVARFMRCASLMRLNPQRTSWHTWLP